MTNVILCGGSGTRLWPLSTSTYPKQFIKLFEGKCLFELSLQRNAKFCKKSIIVSNSNQYFNIINSLSLEFNQNTSFILEPIAKNTAAAIAFAAFSLEEDDIMLVTPSDHLITNLNQYEEAINQAKILAQNGYLVTFGITPNYINSGFGYIKAKNNDVLGFYEKPSYEQAAQFIKSGDYFFNSGIFVFSVKTFLQELKYHQEDIFTSSLNAYKNATKENNLTFIPIEFMEKIQEISIDYALMQKSKNIKMVKANFNWSDVGSFDALFEVLPKDENQNTKNSNLLSINSHKNLIINEKNKKIALIDIDDLVVVDTQNALLICKNTSAQKVKQLVEQIKSTELENSHSITFRPWGSYSVLETSLGYKIKKIEVKPNKRLSLQKHFHRNEHWVVVSGSASIEIDGVKTLLRPNESIYIQMGQAHRLSNEGKINVILVEVQVGEYTNEDDIVRLEDDFGRK